MTKKKVGRSCNRASIAVTDLVAHIVHTVDDQKREGRSCKKASLGSLGVTDLVAAANLVLAFSYSFWTDFTKSAFSQTRYTDSVLASLEPRLFHSKLFMNYLQNTGEYVFTKY